jgi:endonuclease/exonuclease/phosphatase (EEP) superfamily protein YafD
VPILIVLLGAVSLVSLFRRSHWPVELLTHFRPQLIVAGLGGTVLCLMLGGRWEWALISLGIALVNHGALPAPRRIKPDAALAASPGLTIVWANVWQKRAALERTLDWAKAEGADLILIGEHPVVDPAEMLAGDYPHRLDTGAAPKRRYAVRIVAYSRTPLEDGAVHAGPGPNLRPILTFAVTVAGKVLNIIAAHPVPPFGKRLTLEREKHIAMLAEHAREPFVVAGDFNVTPWSPGFQEIPGRRVGAYLFTPTWLSNIPLLGLPIDHIMLSPALKASAYRVAGSTGSDHRAILTRVHFPTT